MKFPLMRNNIAREDLDALIEHLKQWETVRKMPDLTLMILPNDQRS